MIHLIDLGVCAQLFHYYFKKIFKCILGCSNLILHSKSPILRRKTKGKVQYCQTVKWAKRV